MGTFPTETAVLILALLVVGESLLAAFWIPAYFRSGIPVFRRDYRLAGHPGALDLEAVATHFRGEGRLPDLVFREIGRGEYAFREAMVWIGRARHMPVMHGRIVIHPTQATISVVGHLKWFALALPFVCFALVDSLRTLSASVGLLGMGVIAVTAVIAYTTQTGRFARVAEVVRTQLGGVGRRV